MRLQGTSANRDLFRDRSDIDAEPIAEGATLLAGFGASEAQILACCLQQLGCAAPFRHMVTPGGQRMSVAMTNCGSAGWVSDSRGYRYSAIDPLTQRPWPPLPAPFLRLATRAASACGFANFIPDACLINRYEPGTRLSMHQDKNERDFTQPIVSVSLGLAAVFLFGGMRRSDRPRRIRLFSGDVVVWGAAARLHYHGVAPLEDAVHTLTGRYRFNLSFRAAL